MKNLRSSLPALSVMLLMAFAVPSYANVITGATGTVTCSSFSLEFTGIDLNASVTSIGLQPRESSKSCICGLSPHTMPL